MIKDKRSSLEQFLREQLLGPGVSKYRYVDLEDDSFFIDSLMERHPLENRQEILDIVPGGVYSTGILFPVDGTKKVGIIQKEEKEGVSEEGVGEDTMEKENSEKTVEEDEAETIDQMYPNSMGFTCCLDSTVADTMKPIEVLVNFRYYKKLKNKDITFRNKYGLLCEIASSPFKEMLKDSQLDQYFNLITKGPNEIIICTREINNLQQIRTAIRGYGERRASLIAADLKYIDTSRIRTSSLSAVKQTCFYALKNEITDSEARRHIYNSSQAIELVESFTNHLSDIVAIFDTRSYGLWQSTEYKFSVPFPDTINATQIGKRSYLAKDIEKLRFFSYELEDGSKAELSLNFQISRDSRRNTSKVFLKTQLVNSSTPFTLSKNDSRYYSPFNEKVNERTFFGVNLNISNEHLMPYTEVEIDTSKEYYDEDDVTDFIYRQYKDFGIGHGCSVRWGSNSLGVPYVQTEYIPSCDTPDVDPTPRNKYDLVKAESGYEAATFLGDSKTLSFKWLSLFSEATNDDVIKALVHFIGKYGEWIEIKLKRLDHEPDAIKKISKQELDKCLADKDRMLDNVNQLLNGANNEQNLRSFRVMNGIMFMQLWHSVKTKNGQIKEVIASKDFRKFDESFYKNVSDELFEPGKHASWRAFQLAFILVNLDGIFKHVGDEKWERRNNWVDLVWFPTGGGKTEAYLGLIALTILNRRSIHSDRGGGTAAIMRYTLRLLTLQQFQRATLMIMALELMRRLGVGDLGHEPIFIGLWVGVASLPNRMSPSDNNDKDNLLTEFRKLAEGRPTKVPFQSCPWCGSPLSPSTNVEVNPKNVFYKGRLLLNCTFTNCSFNYTRPGRATSDQGPIPVSLCDEEIYLHPPALLFGTVDKFAQLAHKVSDDANSRNKDSRRLFGKGNWESGKPRSGYLPPRFNYSR
jgi:hypothetical protein